MAAVTLSDTEKFACHCARLAIVFVLDNPSANATEEQYSELQDRAIADLQKIDPTFNAANIDYAQAAHVFKEKYLSYIPDPATRAMVASSMELN